MRKLFAIASIIFGIMVYRATMYAPISDIVIYNDYQIPQYTIEKETIAEIAAGICFGISIILILIIKAKLPVNKPLKEPKSYGKVNIKDEPFDSDEYLHDKYDSSEGSFKIIKKDKPLKE